MTGTPAHSAERVTPVPSTSHPAPAHGTTQGTLALGATRRAAAAGTARGAPARGAERGTPVPSTSHATPAHGTAQGTLAFDATRRAAAAGTARGTPAHSAERGVPVRGIAQEASAQAVPVRGAERVTPAAVDAYARRVLADTGVPGMAVVVTHRGRVVRAAGYGREANGRSVGERTPMRVASLTKAFTAAAVLRLVRAGRIELDRSVAEQLPEFRIGDPRGARVTVRQLLNQTSGLTDQSVRIDVASDGIGSLREEVARLRAARLASAPGTRWAYCNVNYDVAARLVEVASGRPFGAYLREHLFAPLGMSDSSVGGVRPANGHNAVFGRWVPRAEIPGLLDQSGAGGVVTDARDMGRWLIAQTGGAPRVLPPSALRTMHTPGPGTGEHRYAMGWQAERDGALVHSGNLFTYYAAAAVVPSSGYGVAVMVNGAGLEDASWTTMEGLLALTRGQTPASPGHGEQVTQLGLAAGTVLALGAGVLGVARARRWARRARVWRLVPPLLPVAVFAAYPQLVSAISAGRRVTWEQLTYFAAPVTIALGAAALAGTATVTARVVAIGRKRHDRAPARPAATAHG